jgi:hypothetical protein
MLRVETAPSEFITPEVPKFSEYLRKVSTGIGRQESRDLLHEDEPAESSPSKSVGDTDEIIKKTTPCAGQPSAFPGNAYILARGACPKHVRNLHFPPVDHRRELRNVAVVRSIRMVADHVRSLSVEFARPQRSKSGIFKPPICAFASTEE